MCSLLFLRSESPSQVFLIVLQWLLALLNTSEAILGTFWPFVNVSDKVATLHFNTWHVKSQTANSGNVLAICERF